MKSFNDSSINECNKSIISLYYRHATSKRNSSYPFISGDTFRAFADYIVDETRRDNLKSVKHGDIVFIKGDSLKLFFLRSYPLIKNPFILVSHNSDASVPREYVNKLEDKNILAWYASNPNVRNHPKLFPIPIGLANGRWKTGNLDTLKYGLEKYRKPWSKRTTLLYVNFNIDTNKKQRQEALSQAKKIQNVLIIRKRILFKTYVEQIGNAKFVLSPPGDGLDCHRTWEALIMGAAPVVFSSELDPLFNNIPAVIVTQWSNLTENLLLSYNFSSYDNLIPSILFARHWRERLLKYRHK
ncbi:unnamed protein product [Rotaria sp. Silwood2]|nr:unnamed protein product [Rotaria sp. Silwood2]CAF2691887.1 unnamed protein product [Rotaria sp. Silwood2]CAF3460428.1 unnamed protein product [Rotaria sp. Silwood2]CAF3906803.1 unnamed protein product [Rotaria sp. Silwood2]CAF4009987.1 unnamed protein product [Rotaria sp. Silwood2]